MIERDRPREHWLLWSGLALSLLGVANGVMVWLAQPGPMERACARICNGITLEEVKTIFVRIRRKISTRPVE